MEQVMELFEEILTRKILKKAVFSKPEDRATVKTVVTPYKRPDGSPALRAERYASDNKALRDNLPYDSAETLARMASNEFRQVNIFTTAGDIEIRRSKSGGVHIAGKLAQDAETAELSGHDKAKNYIIDPSEHAGFLTDLGLADKNGRIHDKKQAKFRQINRFLEIIRDIEDSLPTDRPIVIYDLCCGKSYLTFAVYYYFTAIRGREVDMCGVDLKADVIDYCNSVAKRQGFTGLRFVSGNINEFEPPLRPDMVISLHACDIATDIVLYNAIRWKTGVILSTPCCHHEMSKQLAKPPKAPAPMRDELAFILDCPLPRQKFCDAATDSLRAKRLESRGYTVTTLELIDPDETPKNLMIRAVRGKTGTQACEAALAEYKRVTAALGVEPYLDRLLKEYDEKQKKRNE